MSLYISGIVYLIFIVVFVAMVIRLKKNSKRVQDESRIYNMICDTIGKNFDFTVDNYLIKLKKELVEFNISEIKHAIALIEGNMQSITIDTIVVTLFPAVISFCSYQLAKEIMLAYQLEIDVKYVAEAINVIIIGIFLFNISPMYVKIKRQKYISILLQYELNDRNNHEIQKLENENLKKQVDSLTIEVQRLTNELEQLRKQNDKGRNDKFVGIGFMFGK